MKRLILVLAVMLAGCSTVKEWVPSFWDDNQSNYIVQARVDVLQIDCSKPQAPQIALVARDLEVFMIYSDAKGSLQADVIRVVEPMKSTVDEWVKRGEGSKMYCQLKKDLLTQQGERASRVILGRW